MEEPITLQEIKEKVRLKTFPVIIIGVGLAFLGLAAMAVVKNLQPPAPPILKEGEYVPAQVVFKLKPGKDPEQTLNKVLQDKQNVFQNIKTGKIVSKFNSEAAKNPKQFTKTTLQLHKKNLRQVFPKVTISDEVRQKILRRNGAKDPELVYDNLGMSQWYVAEVNESNADVAQLIQRLEADRGNVEKAGANGVGKTLTTCSNPNDPYSCAIGDLSSGSGQLDDQYSLSMINARDAWQVSTGRPSVIIAVLDTGVDSRHPELSQKMWINYGEDINHNGCADYWPTYETHPDCRGTQITGDENQLDDDGNGFIDDVNGMSMQDGKDDFYHNSSDGPADVSIHGTSVAAIAAGTTNNTVGIAGVCPGCVIMPLRADYGGFTDLSLADSITYAVNNGADILNLSLGGDGTENDTQLERIATQAAHDHGVTLIAAAGNENANLESGFGIYPAVDPNVIAVGAADFNGDRWYDASPFPPSTEGSNWGQHLWLLAPGWEILSARAHAFSTSTPFSQSTKNCFPPFANGSCPIMGIRSTLQDYINEDYLYGTGTSLATPIVSGTVGLMLSVNPTLSPDDIKSILQDTAHDLTDVTDEHGTQQQNLIGWDKYSGYGLVNAAAAVQEAQRRIPDLYVNKNENRVFSLSANQLSLDLLVQNNTYYHVRNVPYRLVNETNGNIIWEGQASDIFPYGWEWVRQTVNVTAMPTYVRLIVDPNNDIPETFENNNQVVIQVRPIGTPVFQHLDNQQVTPGQLSQVAVSAVDPENQTLIYAVDRLPAGSTFTSQNFTWTPASNQIGRYRATFSATDPQLLSDKMPITFLVQDLTDQYRTLLNPIGDQEVRAGKTLSFTVSSASTGSPYQTYLNITGLPSGATFNPTTGVFTWTPTTLQQGAQTVTFSATNTLGREFKEAVQINVVPNQPPVFLSAIGDKTVNEGDQLAFVLNGWDPDIDPLTYSFTVENISPDTTFDGTIGSGTGVFIWNPPYSAAGTYGIRFTVSDGVSSAAQDVQMTVVDVTAPKYTTIMSNRLFLDSYTFRVREGFYASDTNPVLPGACVDTDDRCKIDWSPLNLTAASIQKSDVQFVRVKMNTFGGWSAALQNTCLDSPGSPACSVVGTSGGGVYTFDLYNNANLYFVEQDGLGRKFGAPGYSVGVSPDWNTWMDLCAQSYTARTGGVAINTTPFSSFFGTTTINRIEVCLVDHFNDTSLRSAWTIEVHRKSMNVAPVLSPISPAPTVAEGQPLTLQLNATDYNDDRLWYSASTLPSGATLNQFTGTLTWTPSSIQEGVYPVTFSVSDKNLSASRTVNLIVTHTNYFSPVFSPITTLQAVRGSEFARTFYATDGDNDQLTYSLVSAPTGATINATTGEFRWNVSTTQPLGITSVALRAIDPYGGTATKTVNINVVLPNSSGGGLFDPCFEGGGIGGKYCANPFEIY